MVRPVVHMGRRLQSGVGKVKVGDLVKMPGSIPSFGSEAIGIVTNTTPDGINRGTPHLHRIQIYWVRDNEYSWEPAKWLEVISASR